MAAGILTRDAQVGLAMAWHGKTYVEEKIDSSNCRINYAMEIRPTYIQSGDKYLPANGRQIVSSDDGLPVGKIVGKDYKLFSNSDIWEAVAGSLSGTTHQIVSCGTVNDRSLGFVSVKISEDFKAANRLTSSVLNVIWGHGGNKAVIARSGFTVIVCQNTLHLAEREQADFKASERHTTNGSLVNLSKAIDNHVGVTAEFKSAMDELHSVDVVASRAEKIYAGFLCGDKMPETKTGYSRVSNVVDSMVNLFTSGKGNSGRTMADVLNGATDYYSHASSGGRDNSWKQFVSSEFGSGNIAKSRFLEVLCDPYALKGVEKVGETFLQNA